MLMLAAYEMWLRAAGARPDIVSTTALWARQLDRALADDDPDTTVVLGSSRALGGFSSAAFRGRHPDIPLYFLTRSGEPPMATLLYLAHETDFTGNIVVDFHEVVLDPKNFGAQQFLLDFFDNEWNWNQSINNHIEVAVSSLVAFRQFESSVTRIALTAAEGGWVGAGPRWRNNNRYNESFYDFSLAPDLVAERRSRAPEVHGPVDPAWFTNARRVAEATRALIERGAVVAFVRFPTSGEKWRWEQVQWPRSAYWDKFVATAGAAAVHFADHATLSGFDLPDYSHLDRRDKDAFTNALLDVLAVKGVTFDRHRR